MALPVFQNVIAYLNEQTVTLQYNTLLDAAHPPLINGSSHAFYLEVNGTQYTVTGATVNSAAMTVTLTFSEPAFSSGDKITKFTYQDPSTGNDTNAIQGIDGADAASTVFASELPNHLSYNVATTRPPAPAAPSAPVLNAASDTGSSNSDGVTSNILPTFTGTADPGSRVTLYDTDGTTILGSGIATGGVYNISVSALTSERHHIKAQATDLAGNVSALSADSTIDIDTTLPFGFFLSPSVASPANATAGTRLGVLSAGRGVTYNLATGDGSDDADNGLFDLTSSGNSGELVARNDLAPGTYHIKFGATSAAGNYAEQAYTFTVADGPFCEGITRGAAAASVVHGDITSVAYIVGFSEVVTGVDTSDFVISGPTTGTITSVTDIGTGKNFRVIIDNVSGNGTLRLDLKASGTGIQNLGGQDIVTGYDAGQLYVIDQTPPARPAAPTMTLATDTGVSIVDGITSNTTPAFSGTADIGGSVKLYDASNGNIEIGSATVDPTGHYTITAATLAAGAHTLYIKAFDAALNGSIASAGLPVIIDTVAPTAILLPSSTVYTNAGQNAAVGTLGATDAVAGGVYTYELVAGTGDTNNNAFTINNGLLTINDPGAVGVATESIHVKVTDAAGNSFEQALQVNVTTAPLPPAAGGGTSTVVTVDGVPVTTTTATLPGGGSGTTVSVPVVAAGAGNTEGAPNVADIALATTNGTAMLWAQVPVGTSLTATGGSSQPAGTSLTQLLAAIKNLTATHDTTDQSHLADIGTQFLTQLSSANMPLLLNTVVVKNVDTAATTPLTLTGTSTTDHHTALVIDTSQLATSSSIMLKSVDFAAVVGAMTIMGNTAGQVITGDAASQHIIVAAGIASQVHSGGGDDHLQYGMPANTATALEQTAATPTAALVANSSSAGGLSAATAILLNGGTGTDTATFAKTQSSYIIDQRDGYVLVTDKADATQKITVTNTENLQFADATITVDSRAELTAIAGMYQTILGRQADIGGFDYWGAAQAQGVSLGQVAVAMLNSSEAASRNLALNGDATHDIKTLYLALFGRAADDGGLAYWKDGLAHGQTIADVANGFIGAQEMSGHKLTAPNWDLVF